MSSHTNSTASSTSVQPTTMAQNSAGPNCRNQTPYEPPENGLRLRQSALKPDRPSAPPVTSRNVGAITLSRKISLAAMVTMAR